MSTERVIKKVLKWHLYARKQNHKTWQSFFVFRSFLFHYLTGVTVRSVRIRAAVDRTARIGRRFLGATTRQQTGNGEEDAQHQNQARDADTNRKTALRYADAVVGSLRRKKKHKCIVNFYNKLQ